MEEGSQKILAVLGGLLAVGLLLAFVGGLIEAIWSRAGDIVRAFRHQPGTIVGLFLVPGVLAFLIAGATIGDDAPLAPFVIGPAVGLVVVFALGE